MKLVAVVVLLVTLLQQGRGSKLSFSSFTALSSHISVLQHFLKTFWACSADPQTRWTRVRVAVVTAQTAVSPVSVTSTVSATMTAALTMKPYVKVSCTLSIQQLFSVSCQLFLCSSSQLVPHLVKEGVGRSTTLRTSATATPSAPSTTTAAATMQTFVTVRVATRPLKYGIVLYFVIFFPVFP